MIKYIIIMLFLTCRWTMQSAKIKELQEMNRFSKIDVGKILYAGDLPVPENPNYIVYYGEKLGIEGYKCRNASKNVRDDGKKNLICEKDGNKIHYSHSNSLPLDYPKKTYIRAMTEPLPKLSASMPEEEFEEGYSLHSARAELSPMTNANLYYFFIGENLFLMFENSGTNEGLAVRIRKAYYLFLKFDSYTKEFTIEEAKNLASQIQFKERLLDSTIRSKGDQQ